MLDEIETLRADLKRTLKKKGAIKEFAGQAEVGLSWLYKFIEKKIADPGASKLAKVRRALEPLMAESDDALDGTSGDAESAVVKPSAMHE